MATTPDPEPLDDAALDELLAAAGAEVLQMLERRWKPDPLAVLEIVSKTPSGHSDR